MCVHPYSPQTASTRRCTTQHSSLPCSGRRAKKYHCAPCSATGRRSWEQGREEARSVQQSSVSASTHVRVSTAACCMYTALTHLLLCVSLCQCLLRCVSRSRRCDASCSALVSVTSSSSMRHSSVRETSTAPRSSFQTSLPFSTLLPPPNTQRDLT